MLDWSWQLGLGFVKSRDKSLDMAASQVPRWAEWFWFSQGFVCLSHKQWLEFEVATSLGNVIISGFSKSQSQSTRVKPA
jgi:hypothetical protein